MGSSTAYFHAPIDQSPSVQNCSPESGFGDRPAAARVVPERMQAGGKLIAVAKVRIT